MKLIHKHSPIKIINKFPFEDLKELQKSVKETWE